MKLLFLVRDFLLGRWRGCLSVFEFGSVRHFFFLLPEQSVFYSGLGQGPLLTVFLHMRASPFFIDLFFSLVLFASQVKAFRLEIVSLFVGNCRFFVLG